ncbi:hypothetical protein NQ293_25570, partial [Escherichia coli]|nr:hypothetical protein [Escherichia coli]
QSERRRRETDSLASARLCIVADVSTHARSIAGDISAAQQQSTRFAPTREYRYSRSGQKEFGLDSLARIFSETIDCSPMALARGMRMTCT